MIQEGVKDLKTHDGFQAETLEKYTQSDFQSYDNYTIIIEVREFKERIKRSY